jgi:hypothetical protein
LYAHENRKEKLTRGMLTRGKLFLLFLRLVKIILIFVDKVQYVTPNIGEQYDFNQNETFP